MEVFDRSGLYVIAGVKGVGKSSYLAYLGEQFRKEDCRKQSLYFYHSSSHPGNLRLPEGVKAIEISRLPMQTGHIFLEAQWAKEDQRLSAVLIDDYRYLLRTEQFREIELSRSEKILYLLTRWRTLSEVYDVPVIVTCGVDDDYIYGRLDKKPKLSDIPDHEYVEAFSDRIILMHREEMYDPNFEKRGITDFMVYSGVEDLCNSYILAYIPEVDGYSCVKPLRSAL